MNKQRLIEAADWAEKNIDPKNFNMKLYRSGAKDKPECDSIGCMVGHLTAIDSENVMENYLYADGNRILFTDWSLDFFDIDFDEWDYLFTTDWADVDNSLEGAIARMRRLANGMTEEEMEGELEKFWKPWS